MDLESRQETYICEFIVYYYFEAYMCSKLKWLYFQRSRFDQIDRIDTSLTEKMEMIQEWFVDITNCSNPEIPREIVN